MIEKPAVIFDLDDTLIVEVASAHEAMLAVARIPGPAAVPDPQALVASLRVRARELWHSLPVHDYCKAIGISSWEGLWARFTGDHPRLAELRELREYYQRTAWRRALLDLGIDSEGLAVELSEAFHRERRKRHVLFPETLPLLHSLKGEYPLGLLTTGTPELQWEKINGCGLAPFFDVIVISGDHGFAKPDPRIFSVMLEKLGSPKGPVCMVGNSLEKDIMGALDAGLIAIWVNREGLPNTTGILPRYEISDCRKLPAILEQVFDV